jgi:hypothetical protein
VQLKVSQKGISGSDYRKLTLSGDGGRSYPLSNNEFLIL